MGNTRGDRREEVYCNKSSASQSYMFDADMIAKKKKEKWTDNY